MRMAFFMWLVFSIELYLQFNLHVFGILPRTLWGIIGIFTAPLLHGSVMHLASNTIPLMFLGTSLYFFYPRVASRIFFECYVYTGILVWLLARPALHIGASGLIYGLAFFMIFLGIFRKDFKSLTISVITIFFYGGMFYGILPVTAGVSWESHLLGACIGAGNAWYYSKFRTI